MEKGVLLLLLSSAGAALAQSPSLEDTLRDLESRTSHFVSGKSNVREGFSKLPENLRRAACQAYPAKSDEDAIALFKRKLAFLEEPGNASKLDPGQADRLARQKSVVSTLAPGIDCARLQ